MEHTVTHLAVRKRGIVSHAILEGHALEKVWQHLMECVVLGGTVLKGLPLLCLVMRVLLVTYALLVMSVQMGQIFSRIAHLEPTGICTLICCVCDAAEVLCNVIYIVNIGCLIYNVHLTVDNYSSTIKLYSIPSQNFSFVVTSSSSSYAMSTPSFQILVCGFVVKMMEMENRKGPWGLLVFSNCFKHIFTWLRPLHGTKTQNWI